MAHDVFISYSFDDKTIADAICSTLEQRGTRCWYAPRDVLPGTDWAASVVKAINESSLMVVVFSARSNRSQTVSNEVSAAVSVGIPIIPFRIEDATPMGALGLHLQSGHWLDAVTPPLERHLRTLEDMVSVLLRDRPGQQRRRYIPVRGSARTIFIAALGVIVILAAALAYVGVPQLQSLGEGHQGSGEVTPTAVTKWKYDSLDVVTTSPAISGQLVFVGSYNRYLSAVTADNGLATWQFKPGDAIWGSLAASEGVVYASNSQGDLYALKQTSDNVSIKWRVNIGRAGSSLFTVVNRSVYASTPEGTLYALNVTDGATQWKIAVPSTAFTPTVDNGTVYVGSSGGKLSAFFASNGSSKWETKLGGSATSSAVAGGGYVYVGTNDGSVHCVNAGTGAVAWQTKVGDAPLTTPTVGNNVIVVGDESGVVHALNSAGTLLWAYKTGGSIVAPPAVANGTFYVGSTDHSVYAFNVTNGSITWKFETGKAVRVAPLVADDVLYVGSDDHFLYALFLS